MNSLYRSFLLLFVFALVLTGPLFAQDIITLKGSVTEAETGEPLAGVHVFISNTTEGATTDGEGNYEFSTKLKGKHQLVASFIGFQSTQTLIYLLDEVVIERDFELEPSVFDMEEIVVRSEFDEEWYSNYQSFKQFFIGTDDFAKETDILNSTVLEFENIEKGEQLRVYNKQPLKIQNNALGYEIEVELKDVSFDPFTNTGYYIVNARYTEMESESRSERRKWRDNRLLAYEGSSRHFFQSLLTDRLRRNKFTLLPKYTAIEKVEDEERLRIVYPTNWEFMKENYNTFLITHPEFSLGHDLNLDRGGRILNPGEQSTISTVDRSQVFSVNYLGMLYRPENVQFVGSWSNDRFAMSLPIGYPYR